MPRKRRNHSPAFKAEVALEAARVERTTAEIAREYGVHANQVSAWKRQLLDGAVGVFESPADSRLDGEAAIKELHAKIGELTVERGMRLNRKRVRRLMLKMGISAIYPTPHTTKAGRGPGHKVFPYPLAGLDISAANAAWAADITYIPKARGFCYLVAIMDVASRRILAWRLSNTIDARFCIEALEEALVRFGTPVIFNTDQGAQFPTPSPACCRRLG